MDATAYIKALATAARSAAMTLASTTGAQRNAALLACAATIRKAKSALQSANAKDMAHKDEYGLSDAMVDRLRLTDKVVEGMGVALEQIAAQNDPVGQTISAVNRPDGLRVEKRRVPIGVIGIIYESRPNVTSDAAGLCLKSGNACILRGGKEAINSNLAIAAAIREGLAVAGLPAAVVTVIDNPDHAIVTAMAKAEGLIDLIIPRGGEKLIRAVAEAATVPVIKHYTGNCHVYVHSAADLNMAERIVLNAKCQRPGTCNAIETLLVDKAVAGKFLPRIAEALLAKGVELRMDDAGLKMIDRLIGESVNPVPAGGSSQLTDQPINRSTDQPASGPIKLAQESDWYAEYLDLVLAVRVVDSLETAIDHINKYGSRHTDAVVTESLAAVEKFVQQVDSSSVMINASTRLADGGVYGLGAEIGISTDKLHARGPMGAEDLTTYKWIVTGRGHVRG